MEELQLQISTFFCLPKLLLIDFMTKSFLFIIWVCLLAFVVANPPTQQNIIKNFKVSSETVKPGEHVHLTWDSVTKKSEVLQFFIGHSTGMGHAPQKLLGK
jgi:hypothetical protein